MDDQKKEKILRIITRICLHAVVFAPVLISGYFFFPAIFPKVVYARLIIEIALGAYIPLIILSSEYRPKLNLVTVLVVLFGLLVVLTSVTGVNFSFSFWGNYERMDGIFTWVHFWALFVIMASVLRSTDEWRLLFATSIAAALSVAGYAYLQKIGSDRVYESGLGRVSGPQANPAYLAGYMLMHVGFAFMFVVDRYLPVWVRVIAGACGILFAWMMLLAAIRGAFVAFVIGVAAFAVLYFFYGAHRRIKYALAGVLVLMAIGLGSIFVFEGLRQHPVINAYARIFNLSASDSTAQTRLISWSGALKGAKEHFWLGVGPQKFDVIFNKYFDPSFYTLVGSETWWDRAHNMVIEVLSTMGIVGLLAYLGIGLALFYYCYRIGKANHELRAEMSLVGVLILAYFIQNLFVFDSVSTYIPIAMLMGYVVWSYETQVRERKHFALIEKARAIAHACAEWVGARVKPHHWWAGLAVAFLALASAAYVGNIKLIRHNRLFLETFIPERRTLGEQIDLYRTVTELSNFDRREVAIKASQFVAQYVSSNQINVNQLNYAFDYLLNEFAKAVEENPQDVRLLLSYGNTINIYAELLMQVDPARARGALNRASAVLAEATDLGPARQQVFHTQANTYLIAQDYDRALQAIDTAAKLNPNVSMTYWIGIVVSMEKGDIARLAAMVRRAVETDYQFTNQKMLESLTQALTDYGDFETLALLYEKLSRDTNQGAVFARLAAIYDELGRTDDAVAAAQKAFELDPSLAEDAERFIRNAQQPVPVMIGPSAAVP